MILKPVTLEHGERYGKLTVLQKTRRRTRSGIKYRVGCECGWNREAYTASQLMSGRITACSRCRNGRYATKSRISEGT